MMDGHTFTIGLESEEQYRFAVDFGQDGVPMLRMDEPPPLGGGAGPNPARVLAAAVGGCMSASLRFCLDKARIPVHGMRTTVEATLKRNEQGRLRVAGLRVRIAPDVAAEDRDRLQRCLAIFEDFCIVGQSVRQGIPIDVAVDVTAAEPAPTGVAGG
jgi:uncharacterized OsmC-like protein